MMEYTMQDRAHLMVEDCLKITTKNPITIFREIANKDYVRMHGPEHHVLDGASILTAFYNAGGKIELKEALEKLMNEGLRMPGATCGLWGVCGAVTSIGAALAIIDGTGPLSTDGTWGKHMEFTSAALARMAEVNGPRCCKRDGFIALTEAVSFVNANYDVTLELPEIRCGFFPRNAQCIQDRCPYFVGGNSYEDCIYLCT